MRAFTIQTPTSPVQPTSQGSWWEVGSSPARIDVQVKLYTSLAGSNTHMVLMGVTGVPGSRHRSPEVPIGPQAAYLPLGR